MPALAEAECPEDVFLANASPHVANRDAFRLQLVDDPLPILGFEIVPDALVMFRGDFGEDRFLRSAVTSVEFLRVARAPFEPVNVA
jgi:hypothetical protein